MVFFAFTDRVYIKNPPFKFGGWIFNYSTLYLEANWLASAASSKTAKVAITASTIK
jgi:hypothetical protein